MSNKKNQSKDTKDTEKLSVRKFRHKSSGTNIMSFFPEPEREDTSSQASVISLENINAAMNNFCDEIIEDPTENKETAQSNNYITNKCEVISTGCYNLDD